MKKLFIQPLLIIILLIFFIGCKPVLNFTVTTNPQGADLSIDGVSYGKTPVTDQLNCKIRHSFNGRISLNEYRDTTFTLQYDKDDRKRIQSRHFNLVQDIMKINLVSFEPINEGNGIHLLKKNTTSIAYLADIESSPNVRSVSNITKNEDTTKQYGPPILSPIDDNKLVYYIYTMDEKGIKYSNIYMQSSENPAPTSITSESSINIFPAYSPDAKYIYFSSNRNSTNHTIWRIKTEGGGGITQITKNQSEDYGVYVSPKEDIIAYTSNLPRQSSPQIWTANSSGILPTQLVEGEQPMISPDGKMILFLRDYKKEIINRGNYEFNPKQIWTINIDGSLPTQLTKNTTYNIIQPRWSPNGKYIVYASDEGKDPKNRNNYDIWVMHSDGTLATQLTTNGSWDDSPYWSYDGKWIYFRSSRGGAWNIWRFQPKLD
jgi:Tol biopolymer transport system component